MSGHPAYRLAMDRPGTRPTLAQIMTAARAGSFEHATALFRAGGFAEATGNAAAMTVAGRLARDRALRVPGIAPDRRAALLAEAAAAFAEAAALDPQPHTRLDEATLAFLAGDRARGAALARDLIAWLDGGAAFAETPWFLAAARAEALLLLGERAAAEASLARAVALGVDSAEDQAQTLRQLRLILAETGDDAAWLDAFRPAAALNFAGHLGVAEAAIPALLAQVAEALDAHRVGAGFGALAAGADLVVAEALLARGAELHVVLPTTPAVFRAQSVEPYGAHWLARYDAALEAAASLRWVSTVSGAYEPLATHLAADVAMGASVLHARRHEAEAVQLLIIDEAAGRFGGGKDTAYLGERWHAVEDGARAQVCLVAPRSAPVTASGAKPREGRDDRRLTAILHIAFAGLDQLDDAGFAEALDTVVTPVRDAAERFAVRPDVVLPSGNARIVAFYDPDHAWRFAAALLALPQSPQLRITGHYGLAHWLGEPAALVGTSVSALTGLAAVALPGIVTASELFASAVFVNQAGAIHAEEIGEWRGDRLFALTVQSGSSFQAGPGT